MTAAAGSARTHHTARRKLRKRLEREALAPEEIERRVEALRQAQNRAVAPQGVGRPQTPYLPGENNRRKRALARRDGLLCHWCDAPLDISITGHSAPSPPRATIDHVTPRSAGGANTLDNLVLACEPCNARRGGFHGPGSFKAGTPSRPRGQAL